MKLIRYSIFFFPLSALINMAPTICKDERNVSNERRTRNGIMKHRNSTVISYGKSPNCRRKYHMFLSSVGGIAFPRMNGGSHTNVIDGSNSVIKHVRSACRVQSGQCAMAQTHVLSTHSYHLLNSMQITTLRWADIWLFVYILYSSVPSFNISNPFIFFIAPASAAGRHVFDPNMYNSTSESGSSSSASSDSNMQSTSAQMPVSFSMAGCSGNSVSSVLNSSEYRGVIERNNRQNKLQIDDDSTDSSSSFCNCSKDSDVEDVVGSNLANVQERFRCVLLNGNWLIKSI